MRKAPLQYPSLNEVRSAARLLKPYIADTPLLRLHDWGLSDTVFLKLENLQPIGVFKIRSMGHAMLCADRAAVQRGVYTASSGNAGIGLAWMARRLGVPATVYAPAGASDGKLDVARKLGAAVQFTSPAKWWQIIRNRGHADGPGIYIDAVRDPAAMAGNGTIGLEIAGQLPAVDTVIVPFGGGGLVCGIASAIRELGAAVRIIVAESASAAPVSAAVSRGRPVSVDVKPSFISGAGAPSVLEEMWPLVRCLIDDVVCVPDAAVAAAIRLLFERSHVVAEGAGAIALAAALAGAAQGNTVCVVSGGNIDGATYAQILRGEQLG